MRGGLPPGSYRQVCPYRTEIRIIDFRGRPSRYQVQRLCFDTYQRSELLHGVVLPKPTLNLLLAILYPQAMTGLSHHPTKSTQHLKTSHNQNITKFSQQKHSLSVSVTNSFLPSKDSSINNPHKTPSSKSGYHANAPSPKTPFPFPSLNAFKSLSRNPMLSLYANPVVISSISPPFLFHLLSSPLVF